jgi:two-component system, OmpR family, sensor kinase
MPPARPAPPLRAAALVRGRRVPHHGAGDSRRRRFQSRGGRAAAGALAGQQLVRSKHPGEGPGKPDTSAGEPNPALPRRTGGRFLAAGLGTRMLALIIALVALWAVVSLVLLNNALVQRLDSRVDEELAEEISDFGRLADRQRPLSGRFTGAGLERLFDMMLARNIVGDGESVITFMGGRPYRATAVGQALLRSMPELRTRWAALQQGTDGEISSGELRFRYRARRVTGAAHLAGGIVILSSVGREHREIDDAVKVTGLTKFGLLVLAALLAWLLARRLLAPVRKLTEAARNATESDLTQRIPTTSGRDEVAELARTFNAMLDRLEAAFTSQRRFLNDASHELRMPLAVVRGHLELITDDPEDRRQTMELVRDELKRMDRIVDELLTLAKAERPDFLSPEPIRTDALLAELLEKVRPLAERDWRLDGTVQEPIMADKQRLVQAVMNLVDNAIQATKEHDTIAIGAAADGDHIRIWVRDAGPGVGVEHRERIFDRFARGPDRPRGGGGSGLGLAIVRAITEAHAGRIELDSSGLGSTFKLVIPRSFRGKVPA